ncbi:phage nozzle protein [Vibrio panuliri]
MGRLVKDKLPSLISGVSQQAPELRFKEQCEEQINCRNDPITGMRKRWATEYLKKIPKDRFDPKQPYKVFDMPRDEREHYKIIIQLGDKENFIDANIIPISAYTGTVFPVEIDLNARKYLQTSIERPLWHGRENAVLFEAQTDAALIVNRGVTVLPLQEASGSEKWQPWGYNSIKTVDYDVSFTLKLDDLMEIKKSVPVWKSGEDNANKLKSSPIITGMFGEISKADGKYLDFEARELPDSTVPTTLAVRKKNSGEGGTDWNMAFSCSRGDGFISTTKGIIDSVDDLPKQGVDGDIIKVNPTDEPDIGYYLKYSKAKNKWEETFKSEKYRQLDPATMPHELLRLTDDKYITVENPLGIYFKLQPKTWSKRTVGDAESNPLPYFCSAAHKDNTEFKGIDALGYYKGRLCFSYQNTLTFSEAGFHDNFFLTTLSTVKESDPIHTLADHPRALNIFHMTPSQQHFLLFCENVQLALQGGDTFTADTIESTVIGGYELDINATPINVGTTILAANDAGQYSHFNEYLLASSDVYQVNDVSAQVPKYIKGKTFKMSRNDAEKMTLVLTKESGAFTNKIYLWEATEVAGERQQSAWSRWEMGFNILDVSAKNDQIFFIGERDGDYFSCVANTAFSEVEQDAGFPILMDCRVLSDTRLDKTALPFQNMEEFKYRDNKGVIKWAYGFNFEQYYEFSPFFIRNQDNTVNTVGRLQMRTITLSHHLSTTFDVIIKKRGRGDHVLKYEGRRVGALENVVGKIPTITDTFKVPLYGVNTGLRVAIKNRSPFQAMIQNAQWEGFWHDRTLNW